MAKIIFIFRPPKLVSVNSLSANAFPAQFRLKRTKIRVYNTADISVIIIFVTVKLYKINKTFTSRLLKLTRVQKLISGEVFNLRTRN